MITPENNQLNALSESSDNNDSLVRSLFHCGYIESQEHSREVVQELSRTGLVIEGFGQDTGGLTDDIVKNFVHRITTEENLGNMALYIQKNNEFRFVFDDKDTEKKEILKLCFEKGLLAKDKIQEDYYAESWENYRKVEALLENKNVEDILDTYRTKGFTSPIYSGDRQLRVIRINSLENSMLENDLSWLEIKENLSTEQDNKLNTLKILSHELGHCFWEKLSFSSREKWFGISESTEIISPYVKKHKEIYSSEDGTVSKEDFAESVMIYLVNSDLLSREKYLFIKEGLPNLPENLAMDYVA